MPIIYTNIGHFCFLFIGALGVMVFIDYRIDCNAIVMIITIIIIIRELNDQKRFIIFPIMSAFYCIHVYHAIMYYKYIL